MKKLCVILMTIACLGITACGNDKAEPEETMESEGSATTDVAQTTDTAQTADADNQSSTTWSDNFEVDSESAEKFAARIKDAVAAKDLEKLADLIVFPIYVGLEEGIVVESKEEFLQLETDKVFSESMLSSIKEADISALSPSMAGFTVQKESEEMVPGITFGVVDGKLAIRGINY